MTASPKWEQLIELDLDGPAAWPRGDLRGCDPYLVWTEASTFREVKLDEKLDIAVLVELPDASKYWEFFVQINTDPCGKFELCFLMSGLEQQDTRFVNGFVSYKGLAKLVQEVRQCRVVRFTLQEARADLSEQAIKLVLEFLQLIRERKATSAIQTVRPPEPSIYLGIIDDGLPFARVRDSASAQADRVDLWDQGWEPRNSSNSQTSKPGPNPNLPDAYWDLPFVEQAAAPPGSIGIGMLLRGFVYGRRLKPLPNSGKPPGPVSGDEYFRSLYFAPAPRQTHGAAVLGLMAPWLAAATKAVAWPGHISGLAMVQLPTRTVNDTAGGSLAMRVLDGLRFILWQEAHTRPDPQQPRPLVVNLSYGVHGGPHDGSSMLERAFAEALTLHPHLHLVLAAGNAHRAGCHAQRRLTAQGSTGATAQVMLRVLPDNAGDTFVEFWLPATADVVLAIRPPGSTEVFEIERGQAKLHADVEKKVPKTLHFSAIYPDQVAQGTQGTMILLVVGNTRPAGMAEDTGAFAPLGLNQRRRRKVQGQAGVWTLTLENRGRTSVTVDAYVERGDAPPDRAWGSRQAYFPDSCAEEFRQNNATPEGTLNGIATLRHPHAHVVGAMRADGRMSDYSAAGPRRAGGLGGSLPDAVVPADWSLNLPGVKTTGFVAGAITRINGTSAACAVYSRWLAEHLAGIAPQLPPLRPAPPPEVDCAPERQPSADPGLRGEGRPMNAPFEVFTVDWLLRHGLGPSCCDDPEPQTPDTSGAGGEVQALSIAESKVLGGQYRDFPLREAPPAPADVPREEF